MAKSCYTILGVSEGADKREIKKAYFKLVRTFSPEKDPEKFQEIRNAYESLMSENENQAQVPSEIPDDPLAGSMMQEIGHYMRIRDFAYAADIASEAQKYFGESETFLYYMAVCQLYAGNTGKAVKSFEKLTAAYPGNLLYRIKLATAYMERGYGKKAFAAFGQAYKMGCREDEFILMYSVCCRDREEESTGVEILLEMVKKENRVLRDSMSDMLEAFMGLFIMSGGGRPGALREIIAEFGRFIDKGAAYLEEFGEIVLRLSTCMLLSGLYQENEMLPEAVAVMEKLSSRLPGEDFAGMMEEVRRDLEERTIEQDERLSGLMKEVYEAFINGPVDYEDEPQLARFTCLEAELCMLEEWPSIRGELDIIEKEYPVFYEAVREFAERADREEKAGKLDFLRERLIKDYDRLGSSISGGIYYERYPKRKRAEEIRWDSFEEGTFVRQDKKTGRNDPCPCGSGKKYKNCCGRNK